MDALLLIAETPNAGNLGHRFLVSYDAGIPDSLISSFVNTCRRDLQSVGGNFIAVRRNVTQRSTGRSAAEETLVLAGVDCAELDRDARDRLVASLNTLLPKVDEVASQIDWTNEKRLVIPHSVLADWITEDLRLLPRAEIRGGPVDLFRRQPSPRSEARRRKAARWVCIVLGLLLAALLATAVGAYVMRVIPSSPPGPPSGPKPPQGHPPAAPPSVTQTIDDLCKDFERSSKDSKQLTVLRARLNDIEKVQSKEITKEDKRRLDELWQQIRKHQQKIEVEHAKRREAIKDFFTSIDKSLAAPTNAETLANLKARIDCPPDPESLTNEDRDLQDGYRKKIDREARWNSFETQFQSLLSEKGWQEAAVRLQSWKDGKETELAELRANLKQRLLGTIESQVNRDIDQTGFEKGRQSLHDRFSSAEIIAVLGKDALGSFREKIDDAQDRFLYDRVLKAYSILDQRTGAEDYLASRVANKRMQREVQALQTYLQTADNEVDLTFCITGISWGNYSGPNRVNVSVQSKKKSENVNAEINKMSDLTNKPIQITVKARPSDCLTIRIRVEETQGLKNIWDAKFDKSAQLLSCENDNWHDLDAKSWLGNSLGNKIRFTVLGIPMRPPLPAWKVRDERTVP